MNTLRPICWIAYAPPTQVGVTEQVVRRLGDGEHVHQVEEQLDVRDPLHAGPVPQQTSRLPAGTGKPHQA